MATLGPEGGGRPWRVPVMRTACRAARRGTSGDAVQSIPHGTSAAEGAISRSALSVLRDDEPIDWDGDELRFVIGIAGHEGGHLEILSEVALAFADTDEVDALLGSVDEE